MAMPEKTGFDLMFLAEAPRRDGTNPKSAFSRGMRTLERLGYARLTGPTWHITDAGRGALETIPASLRAVFSGTKALTR